MTTTYHTPVATGAAANAATFNTPFSQLDSRLVIIDNAIDTDGSLKAGAVDAAAVIANSVVTDAKLQYPVRIAWFGIAIGTVFSSIAAHTATDTEWNAGLTAGNFAFVQRVDAHNTPGIVWDAWVLTNHHVILRAQNVTASTVNLDPATTVLIAVVDLYGDLGESSESVET
jgi:hypothetical protein